MKSMGGSGGTGHTDTCVRDMCAPVADSCWQKPAQCCKANIFQKKKNVKKNPTFEKNFRKLKK